MRSRTNQDQEYVFLMAVMTMMKISSNEFDTELQIPLKIFNDKQFNLYMNYKSTVKFDVTGMKNVELNIKRDGYSGGASNYKAILCGSQTKADQSSIYTEYITLESESKNIHFNSLSMYNSVFYSLSSITVNNFSYVNREYQGSLSFKHKNNFIEISNTIIFKGNDFTEKK